MYVIKEQDKLPMMFWSDYVENGAMEQARHLASLPFAYSRTCFMADIHQGFGMPIGGVLATKGVVIPNAVGSDIGCGVIAIRTDARCADTPFDDLYKTVQVIKSTIPTGFKHRDKAIVSLDKENLLTFPKHGEIRKQGIGIFKQLGTLGSGNHFIEIQRDTTDDFIWIMVHTGSRNIGYSVAKYYRDVAINLNEKWKSSVPKYYDLAFLPLDSEEGRDYFEEMNFCMMFGERNRKVISDLVLEIGGWTSTFCVECKHNYAVMENHNGKNLLIHRKGAVRARTGDRVVIPGSQGTSSFIGTGKGNETSFMSCSHGAGRVYSRKKAKTELSLEDEMKKMDDMNIIHDLRTVNKLDEAAGAYKDIHTVMEQQSDLVSIDFELVPLAVIKG